MNRGQMQRLGGAFIAGALALLPQTGALALGLHELGHAAAGPLSGGRVKDLQLFGDGSGHTVVAGGDPAFILSVGPLLPLWLLGLLAARLFRSPSALAPFAANLALCLQLRLVMDLLWHGLLSPGPRSDVTQLAQLVGLPVALLGLGLCSLGLLSLLPVGRALWPRPWPLSGP